MSKLKSQAQNYVDAMKEDIAAERLHQQITTEGSGESFRGCWIGCVLRAYSHRDAAEKLGWPLELVRIAEAIFEGMSPADAQEFAVDVLQAPLPDSDQSLTPWIFLHEMVVETLDRHACEKTRKACASAVEVLKRKANGHGVNQSDAADADADADADAAAAAYAAAADAAAARQSRYKELGNRLLAIMRNQNRTCACHDKGLPDHLRSRKRAHTAKGGGCLSRGS